jgi:hypothetical protein
MEVGNGVISTTTKVWEILLASYDGDLDKVKKLTNECPEFIMQKGMNPNVMSWQYVTILHDMEQKGIY